MDNTVIDNDFYTATLDENGNWITKAKLFVLNPKDIKYKDVPRYPLIYEYEGRFKKEYDKTLSSMLTAIGKKLIEINKRQK